LDVGDHATFRGDRGRPVELEVVGIGVGPNLSNQQFGGGVMLAPDDVERVARTQPFVGASLRFAPGVDPDAVIADYGEDIEAFGPSRPPDVDNLAQLGALPELLAGFLALVAVAVLAHLLVTTARRRRRDLDTLRAMGFVPRQARAVIAIVAVITVGIGLAIGVPFGIAAGRLGWRFTAHSVYVAGDPRVPLAAMVLLVVAALLAATLASIWPAWRAADGPLAAGLREE
jgi:FtsX-like permease family